MFPSRGSARSAGSRRSRARSATWSCAERSSRRTAATPTCRARCTRCRSRIAASERRAGRRHARAACSDIGSSASRTPRAFEDASRVSLGDVGRGAARGGVAAGAGRLAIAADGDADGVGRRRQRIRSRRSVRVAPGGREQVAFYLAVGPERDGAEATGGVLRRRGWRELLSSTRDALQSLEQSTGNEAMDRLINRNLLFAYFYARRPRARRRAVLSRSHARAVERPRRDGARLGSADVDDSRGATRRSVARARAVAPHVRAARLRAGPRRALSRRHAVRAGLRARGRRELSDRDRSLHPRHGRRSRRRRAGARRHAVSRAPKISTRGATSAFRSTPPR